MRFTPPFPHAVCAVDLETGEWTVSPSVYASVLEPPYAWSIMLAGPTDIPLPQLPIVVDQQAGTISLKA